MTTDGLRAKFLEVIGALHPFWDYAFRVDGSRVHDDYMDPWVECAWQAFQAAHASRDAEVEALRKDVARLRKDADRINWLALHPRGAKITIEGTPQDCIFWGISSAPNNTLREAIDAAMREESK